MTYLFEQPTQIELQISPDLAQQTWRQSQQQPTVTGQWNEYISQICLQTFLPWLQTEYTTNIVSNETSYSNIWTHINGAALSWGNKRIILIPEISIDTSEYTIPQEWVDIPKFVGDYYIAVQVNPDELSLRVWGYTTHQQIKSKGTYNSLDRTYSIDESEVIQDLNVLWVVTQLNPDEETRVPIANLSPVPVTQAENLLSRLVSVIQPRLEIPFSLWGELLSDDNWRQRFYQLRQGRPSVASLSQWLQNIFDDSWQSLDSILSSLSGASGNLDFSLRNTEDDTSIKRVKRLNLPSGDAFLVLGLSSESDGRIGIRIQLRSVGQDEYLLPDTNLKLVAASGQVIQSVASRSQDNIIQLKRFKSPVGVEFSIQVEVGDFVVMESCVA